MNGGDSASLVYSLVCLVLVGSALASRRLSPGHTARLAGIWIAIFAIVILLYAVRDDAKALMARALWPDAGIVEGKTLRVPMAEDGHFWVRGSVDGRTTRFLIDSGASVTALSDDAAKGLDPSGQVAIDTANGTVIAHRVHVTRLEIGPIVREDFPGVTAAEFGDTNVLGMNFLSSLAGWGVEGRTLVLRF